MANIEALIENFKDLDLGSDMPLGQQFIQMQKLVNLHEDQLTQVNSILEEKMEYMNKQIETLDKEMGEMNEKLNIARLTGTKSMILGQSNSKISLGTLQVRDISYTTAFKGKWSKPPKVFEGTPGVKHIIFWTEIPDANN